METMAENKGGNTEEKMLKEWMRAQETASKGVIITDVKIEDSVVKIEGWVKSARIEGKEYGVLLPLERGLKGYMIRMDEATHECNDIKYGDYQLASPNIKQPLWLEFRKYSSAI